MSDTLLTGSNFIAGKESALGAERFSIRCRQGGEPLPVEFALATDEEVRLAAFSAAQAAPAYAEICQDCRAKFLEAIADEIEALGDTLIEMACAESGLPVGRITGERGRTCGQLRMFAGLVREGSWVDARIDHAQPDRAPTPKPDLRRMLIPLGPVAVFGASNFPLAFSVAGGDTASALAAGCPVVVKAHPAHPGTSELVARAITAAAAHHDVPAGVFNLIHGGAEVGQALVKCPEIEAVAFTGSPQAGRALFDLGASRPRPIPVFAEMGSVNPFILLPGALDERGEALAVGYASSLTMGVGQFCTNPGVVLGLAGVAFDAFVQKVGFELARVQKGIMLTDAIEERFNEGVAAWAEHYSLTEVFRGPGGAFYATEARQFLAHPEVREEVFGPGGIAVSCGSLEELEEVLVALHGQLTVTVQKAETDLSLLKTLLPLLAQVSGRVLVDGYPTGVEVCPSMQHGGPYPATTDSRSTSVGTAAIYRFARPVAFQNLPAELLPIELLDNNPRGILRTVDGVLKR